MDTTPTRDRRIARTVNRLLAAIDRTVKAAEQVKQARQELTRLARRDAGPSDEPPQEGRR
jgi:methyl-accepting chemotaxis protein